MQNNPSTIFLTWVHSPRQKDCARLLIDSLRAFGGPLGQSSIWVFETDPGKAPCASLAGEGIEVIPLETPEPLSSYLFGHKVYACAQAEALAPQANSLIWLDAASLVVQPPRLLDLGSTYDAALRPVHIRNVGIPINAPLDEFWRSVYQVVGVPDISIGVESFIDPQRLRAYFNTAVFAVRPDGGVFHRWLECFKMLVKDEAYQRRACSDEPHQIFLHQAILSALLIIHPRRIRILPPDYSYPLHLHPRVAPERRPAALNNLSVVVYEELDIRHGEFNGLAVHEPLATWIANR
jgi:hypothetical protein